MHLKTGDCLGSYEIAASIGAGGMGEVYRARDTRLGRDVAIKILPEAFARDEDRMRRFAQEARAVAALNHPNVLSVYDTGVENGVPYLVSELLEGESLRQRLDQGPIPARKAVEYAQQIADGLAAAHEKNIVHRDLKPENIYLTGGGRVKILDFGLAKLQTAATNGPASGSADGGSSYGRLRHGNSGRGDESGRRDGDGRLHGARTGARAGGRSSRRYFQLRRRAV